MLIPIKKKELEKLIPAVATGNQFNSSLGNPRKILQRFMISSIGGVITLLISQSQVASQFYSLWLIIGVVILLYILWGPIIEGSRKNSQIRRYPFVALFEGIISKITINERVENSHEQANQYGKLELVENRRTWLLLELEDEDGYLATLKFPMEKKHQLIRVNSRIRCLVFSNSRDFSRVNALSDAWLPNFRLWVGEYPFLLRPAFEEICRFRLR